MRALVTGGGGFLGHAIVQQLRERGDEVRSLARGDYPALSELGAEAIRGDVGDLDDVMRAAAGCDVVFHTAAKPPAWGPRAEYERTNITGTHHVIDACRRHGIRQLVYTSSPSVVFAGTDQESVDESAPYPTEYDAHYPRTKAEAERAVRSAADDALQTVSLRPHLIWGPGDNHLVPRILERGRAGQLRRVGNGGKLIDTVYIDDAARAHLLAADRLREGRAISGNTYFITSGEPIETWEMVNRILDAGGLPPVRRSVSPRVAYLAGWLLEVVYGLLRIRNEPRMTRFVARELSTSHWFDISAARRDLGYEPTVSIDEGLRRLQEWLGRR